MQHSNICQVSVQEVAPVCVKDVMPLDGISEEGKMLKKADPAAEHGDGGPVHRSTPTRGAARISAGKSSGTGCSATSTNGDEDRCSGFACSTIRQRLGIRRFITNR